MKQALKSGLLALAIAGVGALLSGCANDAFVLSDLHQTNDFGRAVQEDLAAQIADPDATYRGPPPPSSGERAALATKRYGQDQVKQPVAQSTRSSGSGGRWRAAAAAVVAAARGREPWPRSPCIGGDIPSGRFCRPARPARAFGTNCRRVMIAHHKIGHGVYSAVTSGGDDHEYVFEHGFGR